MTSLHQAALDFLWQDLVNGNLVGFVVHVYTQNIGNYAYIFPLLYILIPIYNRSRSVIYVSIIWILAGVGLVYMLPPGAWGVASIILYLAGGGLIYYLVNASRDV